MNEEEEDDNDDDGTTFLRCAKTPEDRRFGIPFI
jgi:hypothetical protein